MQENAVQFQQLVTADFVLESVVFLEIEILWK